MPWWANRAKRTPAFTPKNSIDGCNNRASSAKRRIQAAATNHRIGVEVYYSAAAFAFTGGGSDACQLRSSVNAKQLFVFSWACIHALYLCESMVIQSLQDGPQPRRRLRMAWTRLVH